MSDHLLRRLRPKRPVRERLTILQEPSGFQPRSERRSTHWGIGSSNPPLRTLQSPGSRKVQRIESLSIDPRAATTLAGLPAPIAPKAESMPADHGLGLDHRDRIQNRGEQSVHPDQDQPIDVPEPYPRPSLPAQYYDLLTQDNVFGLESRP